MNNILYSTFYTAWILSPQIWLTFLRDIIQTVFFLLFSVDDTDYIDFACAPVIITPRSEITKDCIVKLDR